MFVFLLVDAVLATTVSDRRPGAQACATHAPSVFVVEGADLKNVDLHEGVYGGRGGVSNEHQMQVESKFGENKWSMGVSKVWKWK
jgi:ferredoxin